MDDAWSNVGIVGMFGVFAFFEFHVWEAGLRYGEGGGEVGFDVSSQESMELSSTKQALPTLSIAR